MSDETLKIILAIIVALPSTIAALGAWRQGRINGKKTAENKVIALDTNKQTALIHDVTNSNYQKVSDELKATTQQVKDLQSLVAIMGEKLKIQG